MSQLKSHGWTAALASSVLLLSACGSVSLPGRHPAATPQPATTAAQTEPATSAPTTTSAPAPSPTRTEGRLIDYRTSSRPQGVLLTGRDDVDGLKGAPDSFKEFAPKQLDKAQQDNPAASLSMYVKGLHTDGYAIGGYKASDGGMSAMWAQKNGSWTEIWNGQNVPDCAPLRAVNFPAELFAFEGTECRDGSLSVHYGAGSGSKSSASPRQSSGSPSTSGGSGVYSNQSGGSCDVAASAVRNGLNKSNAQIKSVTCSKSDPNWAVVDVDAPYGSSSNDIRGALAFMHRSGSTWKYVGGGFHAGGWCTAAKDPSFPSDFKSKYGC